MKADRDHEDEFQDFGNGQFYIPMPSDLTVGIKDSEWIREVVWTQ